MRLAIIIFLSFISQNIFSQKENIKPYAYKIPNGEIILVEIDTIKYKPNGYKGLLYKLYDKEIDASVFINKRKANINDTIKGFEKAKKEFEFTNLCMVNGEKTITLKNLKYIKDQAYINFLYIKIFPNHVLNFTVTIPEKYFEAHKEEFIKYARSMKLK